MRVLALLVFSAAVLAPGLAGADPTQPQTVTAPATAAPSTTAAATAQSAQAPAAAAAPAATASTDSGANLDEVVCRSEPPTTGTRLGGGRECHTVRQWNERQHEEQRMIEQRQEELGMHTGN